MTVTNLLEQFLRLVSGRLDELIEFNVSYSVIFCRQQSPILLGRMLLQYSSLGRHL